MPDEMDLEPEPAAHQSALVANTAEADRLEIEAICNEIRDRNDQQPWGTDQAGREFAEGDSGYTAHVNEVLEHCTSHSRNVEDLAVNAGVGALTSELADEAIRDEIQAASAEVDGVVGELNALLDGAHGDVAAVWANPDAADAVADLNSMASNPQAREALGEEMLGQVDDLMGRVTGPDQ